MVVEITKFDDAPTYDEMMGALQHLEAQTHYVEADLTQFKFERDCEWGSIDDGLTGKKELTEWSCRQLCRLAGIPFTFFRRSSSDLAKDTFCEWIPLIKNPQVKLAMRSYGKSKEVIRGVLPVDYPQIRNSEVLASVMDAGAGFVVESAKWMDTVDPPYIRTRFVLKDYVDEVVKGDNLSIGLDVVCSELNAIALSINLLLFRHVCRNGAIAVYDNKPYFYYTYNISSMFEMVDVTRAAVNRAAEDVGTFFSRARNAIGVVVTPDQAKLVISDMVKANSINKGIAVRAINKIDKDGGSTGWDVVNALTASARDFRDNLRLRYEMAAGSLLGLNFSRKKDEDKYGSQAPERPLSLSFKIAT